MMRLGTIGFFVLIALAVLASQGIYTVQEYEQVVVTEFGRIVGKPITQPGLHFKTPFVQDLRRFDKRWLEWDGDPNEIPTKDKKYIWIDTYARWRIKDPIAFYERLRDELSAQSRINDIIDGEVRNVIANHNLIEIVRQSNRELTLGEDEDEGQVDSSEFIPTLGREKLTRMVVEKAAGIISEYGIELADIQVKRINYISTVQQKVFERMISERKRIAERYRSEGQGKAAEIMGKIDRELRTIQSEAYRKAEEVRGKADARATAIYADAYNRDPDFYEFVKTMEAYETIIDGNTDLVLSTDAQLLRFLQQQ